MIEKRPTLVFAYDFDEQAAQQAEARGYLSHAHVELPDGSRYPVVFYDLVRLGQDLEEEVVSGKAFIADPGMVVVPDVTLDNMERAISNLYREGFFSHFQQQTPPSSLSGPR